MLIQVDQELTDIFPRYLESRRKDMTLCQQAIDNRQWDTLWQLAHKISGNAGAFGLESLAKLSRELEVASKKHDELPCRQLVREMEEYLADLKVVFVAS